MLLQAITEYWVLYGMLGIFAVGLLSRIWLFGIISGLLKDTRNMGTPKKKLMKQMKLKFESCYRLNEGINNVDAFVVKNLYGHRFLGMTIDGIKKLSGQALFFCLLIGGLVGGYSYYMGLTSEIIIIYAVTSVSSAGILLYINCMFDAPRKEIILDASIMDYLENYLAAQMDRQIFEEELGLSNSSAQAMGLGVITEEKRGIARKRREMLTNRKIASDMEYLKQSFDQIAVDLERKQERASYVSSKEDEKIIEDVICEFLG